MHISKMPDSDRADHMAELIDATEKPEGVCGMVIAFVSDDGFTYMSTDIPARDTAGILDNLAEGARRSAERLEAESN